MESSKKSYLIAAVLVAVVIAGIGYSRNRTSAPEASPSASVSPSKTPGSTKASGTAPKTYTEYVKAYADRRVQFDINCQAVPSSLTFKNGTAVMFDNRSGDPRTIKIGDTTYQFQGYGYKVLTLTSKTLPKNLLISCGSAVNVGQILLQK